MSYEEYFPYAAVASQVEVPVERYRFCVRERDDESGLDYGGARYYAAWLGRRIGCGPAGFVDGLNLYAYTRLNPVRFDDLGGTQSTDTKELQKQTPAAGNEVQEAIKNVTEETMKAGKKGTTSPTRPISTLRRTRAWRRAIPTTTTTQGCALARHRSHGQGRGVVQRVPGASAAVAGDDLGAGHVPRAVAVDAGFGVGGALGSSAVNQNGLTAGMYGARLVHFSLPARNDWAVGGYGQFGGGVQKNPDGSNAQDLSGSRPRP